MLRLFGLTVIAFCLSPQIIWGQRSHPNTPQSSGNHAAVPYDVQTNSPQTAFPSVRGLSQDYRVGVGDTLEIQVVDTPELNQTLRISASGEISFLSVGTIRVQDLTAAEVEAQIVSALKEKKLVQEPQVLVFIKEYQAKRIYLMGEFAFPGEFFMSQNLTVMDAIMLAGGLGAAPIRYGYIHRHASNHEAGPPSPNVITAPAMAQEGTEVITIDLKPMIEGRSPEPDPMLKGGDYLIVPQKKMDSYFVLGDVRSAANFQIPDGKTITISQAIAQAGGAMLTAKKSGVILARKTSEGARQEIKVNYSEILKGKQTDIEIHPDDIVYVPSGKFSMLREQYVSRSELYVEGTVFRIGRYYQLPEEARR
jgi:polysaccharide biosynthesis/export protein